MEYLLVCYDIANPKRLRKMEKHMESYGKRLQDSVFLCYLDGKDVYRMRSGIALLMKDAEDSVLYIRLCKACFGGIEAEGVEKDLDIDASSYFV